MVAIALAKEIFGRFIHNPPKSGLFLAPTSKKYAVFYGAQHWTQRLRKTYITKKGVEFLGLSSSMIFYLFWFSRRSQKKQHVFVNVAGSSKGLTA